MPASIPANGVLAQRLWDSRVTLFTESQCIAPHLYGTDDGACIHVEARQDQVDQGGGRGSKLTFYYGDRFRGQSLAPRALGSTGFGQATGQRPTYQQDMWLAAHELASAGHENLVAGQQYTNVPLEKKELMAAGAEAAELLCRSHYYHLAGVTAYNSSGSLWTVSPFGNDVTEVDTAHRFWTNGKTTDAGVAADANSILTVEYLETVITRLQSRANGVLSPLVPADTPWGKWFVFICDTEGVEQLNRHSSTNRFTSLTLAEIQGGNDVDKVASFMRANSGFESTRRILVLVDDYTPFAQSGSTSGATTAGTQIGNARRGMLLGRFAAHHKWGQHFDAEASHIKASYHSVHMKTEWIFYTHAGSVATIANGQRYGSATITYYVAASTPTN